MSTSTLRGLVCGILLICLACTGCTRVHGNDGDPAAPPAAAVGNPKFTWQPVHYDSSKRYIYLSFDDGPQHGTVTCFDLCRSEKVKATFFMVGLHTAQKTDGRQIVEMIRDNYPNTLLANHSYTHARDKYLAFYHHPLEAEQDFFQAQSALNVPYRIVRFPGNGSWVRDGEVKATKLVRPVAELLDSAGYNVIGWDVEWNFSHKNARPVQTPEKLAAQVDSAFARNQTHVRNHLVILSHDRMFQHPADADSLASFIRILKRDPRNVFETVDHYPGLKKPVFRQENTVVAKK